jgi:hypothetical protein
MPKFFIKNNQIDQDKIIITGEDVAVKIEPKEINPSLLEVESYFLCKLKGGKTISTYLLALFHRWNPRN